MRKKIQPARAAEDEDLVTGAVASGLRPVGQNGNGKPNGDGPQGRGYNERKEDDKQLDALHI